jgi:hypothetical protein
MRRIGLTRLNYPLLLLKKAINQLLLQEVTQLPAHKIHYKTLRVESLLFHLQKETMLGMRDGIRSVNTTINYNTQQKQVK